MSKPATSAFQAMDAMYRNQRYFYDATRKFYLMGRDQLLSRMNIASGMTVAEIGCGTGRNLEILARRYRDAQFFGLDASAAMLRTAHSKIEKAGLDNVNFRPALADEFTYRETFGLDEALDIIFFSYSITMIPTWRESIERSIDNLKPGGKMYIVDFYDQRDLPAWFKALLKAWLRKFHVQFWSDLMPFLYELDKSGAGRLEISTVARRYAFIADFTKAA